MGHPSKDLGERVRGWGGGSCLGQRPFLVLVFPPQSPCRLSHHNHPKTRQKQKSVIRISGCLTNNRSSQMHEAIGHNRNSTPLKNETYSLSYALIISSWSGVNNRFPMSIDKATCNGAALNFLIKLILVKMKLVKHGHVQPYRLRLYRECGDQKRNAISAWTWTSPAMNLNLTLL